MHDIIIIGGGPAGLTAAVYGLRNGKSVLVIEKSVFGGQITNSPKVENIPGFESISGDAAEGRTLILATGTKHRLLGLPGEEDLVGDGISFCAVCDGDFYRDKTVVMIGGGNSAFVEANLLVEIVDKLIMLQDLPFFTAEQKMQDQLFSHDNVETHVSTKILAYEVEDGQLKGVRYEEGGEEKTAYCDGVFLAVGLVPDNGAFTNVAELDGQGYFNSGESCETSTPGIFVAGDCRTKSLRQVATACGDGAIAAIAATAPSAAAVIT